MVVCAQPVRCCGGQQRWTKSAGRAVAGSAIVVLRALPAVITKSDLVINRSTVASSHLDALTVQG